MSRSGITFQPKPEGNHFVTIHLAYKVITDGKASTAGLLSAFEYLAESTLSRSPDWAPNDPIPEVIQIQGTCSNGLLMKLLDGLIRESALKSKIRLLEKRGYIKTEIVAGRYRHVWYNYAAISKALAKANLFDPSKSDPSKSDPSKSDPSKSDGTRSKSDGTRSKSDGLRGQKVTATIPITNPVTNPDLTNTLLTSQREECDRASGESSSEELKPVVQQGSLSQRQVDTTAVGVEKKGSGKGKTSGRRQKTIAEHLPETFDEWWNSYQTFCGEVEASVTMNQNRYEAVAEWDRLIAEGVDYREVLEGSAWYIQCKKGEFGKRGEAIGVSHGFRFLRNRVWQNALDHKRKFSTVQPPQHGARAADAELRQNWLPNMSPALRAGILQNRYATASYSDLTDEQIVDLLTHLKSLQSAQEEVTSHA